MAIQKPRLLEEVKKDVRRGSQALNEKFVEHDITLDRQNWQPRVITKDHLNRHELTRLKEDSRDFPDLNINAAIESFTYSRYMLDERRVRGLFPLIPAMSKETGLYVCFPRSYTAGSLTKELRKLEAPVQISPTLRDHMIENLRMFFKKYWPEYYMSFTPYGSYVSGLGFFNTYLNINIQLDDPDLQRLVEVPNAFEKDVSEPFCKETTIPLFVKSGSGKISFESDIGSLKLKLNEYNIEYNFNKEIFTYSTNLINHYLNMDPRVQNFLFAIKMFGRGRNIFASQIKHGVRYYGYTILALAYLSQLDPPVIPNLQHIDSSSVDDTCSSETCFSKRKYWDRVIYENKDVGIAARYHDCVEYDPTLPETEYYVQRKVSNGKMYWNSKNKSSVGDLFLDFLHYYGYRFDFNSFAVSLKFNGKTAKNSNWKHHFIAIEDPFMTTTNLASAVPEERKFIDVFKGAFSVLRSGTTFEVMCKKIHDLAGYDSPRGVNMDRPVYIPFPGWTQSATSKAFVLIGLPKLETDACYCERINNLFSTHGKINRMLDLDRETKQVFFSPDTGDATTIVLPSTIMLNGNLVHLVELYNFTISSIKS